MNHFEEKFCLKCSVKANKGFQRMLSPTDLSLSSFFSQSGEKVVEIFRYRNSKEPTWIRCEQPEQIATNVEDDNWKSRLSFILLGAL